MKSYRIKECTLIAVLKALALCIALLSTACDPTELGPLKRQRADADSEPQSSPNSVASPLPNELNGKETGNENADAGADGGNLDGGRLLEIRPTPYQPNEKLASIRGLISRDQVTGIQLGGRWTWRAVPDPASTEASSKTGLDSARRMAQLEWTIQLLSTGRMRVEFASRGFLLRQGTTLLSRRERYGAIVVWPRAKMYRVAAPGSFRTLLGEARLDVTPLYSAHSQTRGTGRRLGMKTRKLEYSSPLGTLLLEVAEVPELGNSGKLLCRLLLSTLGFEPRTCRTAHLPLAASFTWIDGKPGGGGIDFEIHTLTRHNDFVSTQFLMPPLQARQLRGGLPLHPRHAILTPAELRAFRQNGGEKTSSKQPPTLARNQSDLLLYLLIDGVRAATVPPWKDVQLRGLPKGVYTVQWRSFLGDVVSETTQPTLPATIVYGIDDAGVPETADAG